MTGDAEPTTERDEDERARVRAILIAAASTAGVIVGLGAARVVASIYIDRPNSLLAPFMGTVVLALACGAARGIERWGRMQAWPWTRLLAAALLSGAIVVGGVEGALAQHDYTELQQRGAGAKAMSETLAARVAAFGSSHERWVLVVLFVGAATWHGLGMRGVPMLRRAAFTVIASAMVVVADASARHSLPDWMVVVVAGAIGAIVSGCACLAAILEAWVFFRLGRRRIRLGERDEGLALLRAAADVHPQPAHVNLTLAAQALREGRYIEAETWAARTIAVRRLPAAVAILGIATVHLRRPHDALALLDEALAVADESWRAWVLGARAHVRLELHDYRQARGDLDLAVASSPDAAFLWSNLGQAALGDGDLDAAERALTRAIELGAAGAARHLRSLVRVARGDLPAARADVTSAAEDESWTPSLRFVLGQIEALRGDLPAAREALVVAGEGPGGELPRLLLAAVQGPARLADVQALAAGQGAAALAAKGMLDERDLAAIKADLEGFDPDLRCHILAHLGEWRLSCGRGADARGAFEACVAERVFLSPMHGWACVRLASLAKDGA